MITYQKATYNDDKKELISKTDDKCLDKKENLN